jgi:hypothetical protein
MSQRDYILQMFEEIGRAIAQIIYQREIKDYEAAHALVDEQLKQATGMGRGFIHSLSDDTLIAMLTTMGALNADKCWLVATMLKVDGEIYEDQQNENDSYYSYLKACNLFLEALHEGNQSKEIEPVSEIEALLGKLEDYELPLRTRNLLFWYFDATGKYGRAEDMLFDMLENDEDEDPEQAEELYEVRERGKAFYARLLGKSDANLATSNVSRAEIEERLVRLNQFHL